MGENIRIAAHRCFRGVYPENTIEALHRATSKEMHTVPDAVEIDLRICRDGKIVVFHDGKLDRLTDFSGPLWKLESEKVTRAEVMGCGNTIPLLEDFLKETPENLGVHLHLKPPGKFYSWEDMVESCISCIDSFSNDFRLLSESPDCLEALQQHAEDFERSCVVRKDLKPGFKEALDTGCSAVNPKYRLISSSPRYRDDRTEGFDLVDKAHSAGMEVHVWTVNHWLEAENMSKKGVDCIFTDYPGIGGCL